MITDYQSCISYTTMLLIIKGIIYTDKISVILKSEVITSRLIIQKTKNMESMIYRSEYVNDKDIELVMMQVSCTRDQAVRALIANNNDLIDAIMYLQLEVNDKDIELVMMQVSSTKDQVIKALITNNNDLVDTIIYLQLL